MNICKMEDICNLILRGEKTTLKDITIKSRKREIVFVRQLCMAMCKKYTRSSLATIGKYLGGKDHATVLHAKIAISNLYDTDKSIKEKIDEYESKIRGLPDNSAHVKIIDIPLSLVRRIVGTIILTDKELAEMKRNCPETYEIYSNLLLKHKPIIFPKRFLPKPRRFCHNPMAARI